MRGVGNDSKMTKRGRKNQYETHVVPYFSQISEWLTNGATERQIAENLGIGYSSFNRYKTDYREFRELLKNGRRNLVAELRGALVKRAIGFDYTETKVVKEHTEFPELIRDFLLENGFTQEELDKAMLVKTEIAQKHALPDVAALNLALKNYDKDNWANDPQTLELKKEELELRKKQVEQNDW